MTAGTPIRYGEPGEKSSTFQRARIGISGFADGIASLRAEIEAAGLWVLHEIDPQKVLRRGGYAIGGARQILFFHPDLMVRLLRADASALLEAPLRYAAIELPENKIMVRWIDTAAAFARYDNPALTDLGQELAVLCERIATASLPGSLATSG